MKHLALLLLAVFIFSCQEEKQTDTSDHIPQQQTFDWLLGKWQRTNDDEGKQTYEHWDKKSDSHYQGLGFTLKEGDTTFKENIALLDRDGTWSFEVSGKGDGLATVFVLTEIGEKSFVCENAENEFPKKIQYKGEEKEIHAVISGSGMEVPFDFVRLEDQ